MLALTAASPAGAARAPVLFVPASRGLLAVCHATVRAVGYAIVPTRVPKGLGPVGADPCAGITVIAAGHQCPNTNGCWCGWVVGSGAAGDQNLAIVASPRPLANTARLVNGPAWFPSERTVPGRIVAIGARRMREVWVPAATNDASSFSDHLALVWTEHGHSYAIGFQRVHGIAEARLLNFELARGLVLVRP